MIKRILIAAILVVLLGICTSDFLLNDYFFNKLQKQTEALYAEVTTNGLTDKAKAEGKNIYQTFHKNRKWLYVYVHYLEIEDISNQVHHVYAMTNNDEDELLAVEAQKLITLIKTFKTLYRFDVVNIL